MIEPCNNFWSRVIYKTIGHEKFDPDQIDWEFKSKDPLFDSNQALSWIIFDRDKEKFKDLFPMLTLLKTKNIMPVSYLISGGHSFNTGLGRFIKIIRSIERKFLAKNFGIFNLICLEKR